MHCSTQCCKYKTQEDVDIEEDTEIEEQEDVDMETQKDVEQVAD